MIPIPGVSKSLLTGGKQIGNNHISDDFLCFSLFFFEKSQKTHTRGLEKGFASKIYENYSGRFPEGVPKKKI